MESEVLRVKHDISNNLNQLQLNHYAHVLGSDNLYYSKNT